MALFDGLMILGLIGAVKQIWKEKTEPTVPANARFDFDKHHEDVMAGVPSDVVAKRIRAGYYHSEPKQFDIKKYNDDVLAGMSPDELESRRLSGVYGDTKPRGSGIFENCDTTQVSIYHVWDVERYEYCRRKYPERFKTRLIPLGYNYPIDPCVYRQYE